MKSLLEIYQESKEQGTQSSVLLTELVKNLLGYDPEKRLHYLTLEELENPEGVSPSANPLYSTSPSAMVATTFVCPESADVYASIDGGDFEEVTESFKYLLPSDTMADSMPNFDQDKFSGQYIYLMTVPDETEAGLSVGEHTLTIKVGDTVYAPVTFEVKE